MGTEDSDGGTSGGQIPDSPSFPWESRDSFESCLGYFLPRGWIAARRLDMEAVRVVAAGGAKASQDRMKKGPSGF